MGFAGLRAVEQSRNPVTFPIGKVKGRGVGILALWRAFPSLAQSPKSIPREIGSASLVKRKRGTFTLGGYIPESAPAIATPPSTSQAWAPAVTGPCGNSPTPTLPDSPNDRPPIPSVNDIRAQYCAPRDPTADAFVNVCHAIHFNHPNQDQ